MRDKIKQLLGFGLSNSVVAKAVGVSESYISQLLADEVFGAEVQELRAAKSLDSRWDALEDKLLLRLEDLLAFGAFTRPLEVIRALAVVNGAKRRAVPVEQHTEHSVVALVLPAVIAPKFVVNAKNQVLEVDGRPIATMPAKVVTEKLKEEDARRAEQRIEKLETLPIHELL